MDLRDKIIWITGASSGIGEAMTYTSLQQGAAGVIISARRKTELERVKQACSLNLDKVHIVPLDLTQSDDFPNLVKAQIDKLGRIDVLINNGGISQRSWVHETPIEIDRKIMEVNYFGQIALTKAILPYMIAQKAGHIAVISSLTGKFGFPLRSAYAASKHALHGFFETLMLELKDNGIRVTLVNPGGIQTKVSFNAITKDGSPHGVLDPGQEKGMSAKKAATIILSAIRRNKAEINMVWPDQIMVYLKRYVPSLFRTIARKINPE